MAEGGTYCLILHLPRRTRIAVGRLGLFDFPAGYYVYVGSALNGLEARLARHLRQDKALHWHVDYLLQHATLVETWSAISAERLECRWAEIASTLPGASLPVPRFGASDCRCPAHLIHFPTCPEFSLFVSRVTHEHPGLLLAQQRCQ